MLQKNNRRFKKLFVLLTMMILVIGVLTVSVSADEGDTKGSIIKFINGAETVLIAVVSIGGAFMIFNGIQAQVEGNAANDPTEKSKGGKLLAAGIGVILVALILIPLLMDLVRDLI